MHELVLLLASAHPQFTLRPGDTFYWSPQTREIFYPQDGEPASLLHEIGHALLDHAAFTTDLDLLSKEVAAWEKAKELAPAYGVILKSEHIDYCLDSYRDWLHMRSTCPTCKSHGLQSQNKAYRCLNCRHEWKVSSSVLCRPYRQRMDALKAK